MLSEAMKPLGRVLGGCLQAATSFSQFVSKKMPIACEVPSRLMILHFQVNVVTCESGIPIPNPTIERMPCTASDETFPAVS